MRLVLDTDVIVAAMRSPTGASAALLRAVREGGITLLLSVSLAVEYEAVCTRAEHQLASGLMPGQALAFVDAIVALAEPITNYFLWRPQLQDPADEMVLETAVNGRADALVTFNVRDYGSALAQFGIQILTPRDALRRILQ